MFNIAQYGPTRSVWRRHSFTLIEMLAVLGIMMMLLALTVPSFDKLAIGSGVDGATRMVSGQARLCRHYAISQRQKVALIMPANETGIDNEFKYSSFRAAIVSGSSSPFTFVEWVPNTSWSFLPPGSSITEADEDAGINGPNDDSPTLVNVVDLDALGGAASDGVRCIIYAAGGGLADASPRYITVSDTTWVNGSWADRLGDNSFDLEVNTYTGRVLVK